MTVLIIVLFPVLVAVVDVEAGSLSIIKPTVPDH